MPVTLVFQSTGIIPGAADPVEMRGPSLTIGRGAENDLVLPDPDRMISKRHCVIEDQGTSFVVIDLSTNGTFLNYSKAAIGQTPAVLNDGDIISLGGYEMAVNLSSAGDTAAALPPLVETAQSAPTDMGLDDLLSDTGSGDLLDDILGTPTTSKSQNDLIPDDPFDLDVPAGGGNAFIPEPLDLETPPAQQNHNASASDHFTPPASNAALIPDDWNDDLIGSDPFAAEVPAPEPTPAPAPASVPVQDASTLPPTGAATSDAARAFMKAAGVDHLNLSDEELEASMTQMGQVMRTMVSGIREVLMTRAAIKSEFRMNQTMIGSTNNNPLKFSISVEQALEAMAKPSSKGYLDPVSSATEALNDVKAHEVAMVSGMEAAMKGVLAKLDPKELSGQIETKGGLGTLLKGKKARYWEVYEKMYSEISDQAEDDFHDLFSKEFAKAYQDQLKKL